MWSRFSLKPRVQVMPGKLPTWTRQVEHLRRGNFYLVEMLEGEEGRQATLGREEGETVATGDRSGAGRQGASAATVPSIEANFDHGNGKNRLHAPPALEDGWLVMMRDGRRALLRELGQQGRDQGERGRGKSFSAFLKSYYRESERDILPKSADSSSVSRTANKG